MDMKAILTLIMATYVLAGSPVTISQFSNSLENELGLKLGRLDDVVQRIRIRKPNALERWMMNKSGAEATYNDKTNTIVLRDKNWRGNRIVAKGDFEKGREYEFNILSSTIFHELMHADFDVLIKGSNSASDIALKSAQSWFSRNTRGVNAHIAAHEFFGYTASDLVFGINSHIQDILLAHGINWVKGTCFGENGLKKIKDRLFKDGEVRFIDTIKKNNYALFLTPSSIFIKGKPIELKNYNFPDKIRNDVYQHFVDYYGAPKKSADLINFIEGRYGKLLRECFQNI